jgi:hypothetical protein
MLHRLVARLHVPADGCTGCMLADDFRAGGHANSHATTTKGNILVWLAPGTSEGIERGENQATVAVAACTWALCIAMAIIITMMARSVFIALFLLLHVPPSCC